MLDQLLVPSALIGFDADVNRNWSRVVKKAVAANNAGELVSHISMTNIAHSGHQIIFDGAMRKFQANEAVLMYPCLDILLDSVERRAGQDREKWVSLSRELLIPLLNQFWFVLAVMASQRIFPPRFGKIPEPETSRQFLVAVMQSWNILTEHSDRYMESDGVPLANNHWTGGMWDHLQVLGIQGTKIREFKDMTTDEIADVVRAAVRNG